MIKTIKHQRLSIAVAALAFLILGVPFVHAQIPCVTYGPTTPNLGLSVPLAGAPNWNVPLVTDLGCLDSGLSGVTALPSLKISNHIDVEEMPSNTNPNPGYERWYANSTTHLLTCLTSSGGNCAPSGGGGGISSITLTVPTGLAVTPPTLTANGTFALTWSGTIPLSSIPASITSNTTGNAATATHASFATAATSLSGCSPSVTGTVAVWDNSASSWACFNGNSGGSAIGLFQEDTSGNATWTASPTFATGMTLGFLTGSTQCLMVNTSGVVSGTGCNGSVSSVFGRTGAVVATSGDYSVPQITGAAPLASPAFTGTVTGITSAMVGLGNVTNNVQTDAAILPNTPPAAGRIPIGNAGGTAYVPVGISGDASVTSAGVWTNSRINGITLTGTPSIGYLPTATGSATATWQAPIIPSVFGRTGPIAAAANDYSFAQLSGTIAFTQQPPGGTGSTVWCGNGTWCTPAAGGNVSNVGTPANGQVGVWTSATTLSGVAPTGTGSPVFSASPTLSGTVTISGQANGCAQFVSTVLSSTGSACGSGGGMVWPTGSGIPQVVSGSSWGTTLGTTGTGSVVLSNAPTFTGTVVGLTSAEVGLGSVTNAAQTLASVVPNTLPSAGQLLIGNSGGTAYAPVTVNGDATLTAAGFLTVTQLNSGVVPTGATVLGSNGSNQLVAATLQGNGAKVQLSSGATTTNDCVKFDANGNTVDAGAACGAGGAVYPPTGIPNSTGSAWGASYSTTGSGTVVVLATSPTLVTPVLGVPTSITLTNATGLPLSTGVTGNLPVGNLNSGAGASASSYWNGAGVWANIVFATNSTNNTAQTGLNLSTSTVNADGLTVTPHNTGTNVETFEVTGSYSASIPVTQITNAVANNAANTYTTGLQSFAAATMKLPSSAGYAPTTAALIGYNSTNNTYVWGNGTSAMVTAVAATGTNVSTTCTNQVVTVISGAAVPTCTSLTSSFLPLSAMGTITGGTWQGTPIASTYIGTLSAGSNGLGTFATQNYATPPAIGGTTPAAGAFTTLSASSTVSGTGFSTYLASPPAIGGTASAAITGTTITATTSFSGALNGTVGATTPAAGSFTTISVASADAISWNSDTGLSRDSAGVIDAGNGTSGNTTATIKAAAFQGTGSGPALIQLPPTTYSALPSCTSGTEGTLAMISDSTVNTWGTAVTVGGGTDPVMVLCDGSNWSVMGK